MWRLVVTFPGLVMTVAVGRLNYDSRWRSGGDSVGVGFLDVGGGSSFVDCDSGGHGVSN